MPASLPVIVVDDQAPFRSAAKAVLRRMEGFELIGEAVDGSEAVAMVSELRPALVLMDINMPGMSGIEATRRIVADDPEVVVVLLSTYSPGDVPPDAVTSGARAYLNKEDFSPAVLQRLWDERDNGGFQLR
ncbi:MAG TPA: response regulator transcription factor [Acidimicrobiales bacterium]|nr:response regulator transcription factor [Acidimicrobiales bacterium]